MGTGESCIRNNVTHGDGVYKSTDGGQTWRNMGLRDTRHIARVRVHPRNPDIVYVAALGHAFGPNEERGVFRSTDGGETWERVLFVSDGAGAVDLSMDPNNPRTMYASMWQVHRSFWDIVSGGPDSGLYKTTDGGDTWVELSERPGLPKETLGRIGVALSPARPDRVWALIEAENGGLFRSDDHGDTWEQLSDDDDLRSRSWYYTHVFADPSDPDTVWVLAAKTLRSTDGGRHFTEVPMPHGDQHDLWIDPRDSRRMIEGNDGGATVSLNGGDTWSNIYNQPTAQLYHITTDNQFPYEVYGTQQDNSGMAVRSYSDSGGILTSDWHTVGMSESGDIAVKPDDPNIVYSAYPHGILNRYDHRNREVRVVTVWPDDHANWPPRTYKYRFAWKFPIVFSPHDPDTLYVVGNMVFRTTDDGTTWEAISPDLTRNDATKMELKGGPITMEGADAEVYCTVYAFAESPIEPGLLWAGSDDGLVHVSRDGGGSWKDVTPPTMPEWTMVHSIDPSPHDAATAYIAATRFKSDDFRPYLYKTNDYGETWQEINGGIPDDDFTRVVREDPARRGLLYCGTESGVYVSADDGQSWESLQCNLPVVPIHDMVVKNGDLVAGTHGRSMWIMDDLSRIASAGRRGTLTSVLSRQGRGSQRRRPAASPSTHDPQDAPPGAARRRGGPGRELRGPYTRSAHGLLRQEDARRQDIAADAGRRREPAGGCGGRVLPAGGPKGGRKPHLPGLPRQRDKDLLERRRERRGPQRISRGEPVHVGHAVHRRTQAHGGGGRAQAKGYQRHTRTAGLVQGAPCGRPGYLRGALQAAQGPAQRRDPGSPRRAVRAPGQDAGQAVGGPRRGGEDQAHPRSGGGLGGAGRRPPGGRGGVGGGEVPKGRPVEHRERPCGNKAAAGRAAGRGDPSERQAGHPRGSRGERRLDAAEPGPRSLRRAVGTDRRASSEAARRSRH